MALLGFVLDRCDESRLAAHPSVVEPVDVLGDGDLEVLDVLARSLCAHREGRRPQGRHAGAQVGHHRAGAVATPGWPVVVLIEDDRVIRLLVSTTLATGGWRVHEAATAAQGVRLASAAARVDCILVDVNLPDGDGIEVVAALRTHPHLVSTPIVVLDRNRGQRNQGARVHCRGGRLHRQAVVGPAADRAGARSHAPEITAWLISHFAQGPGRRRSSPMPTTQLAARPCAPNCDGTFISILASGKAGPKAPPPVAAAALGLSVAEYQRLVGRCARWRLNSSSDRCLRRRCRADAERQQSRRRRPHCWKRYPTPGTVITCRGAAGSSSSLRRSCPK